MHVEPVNYNLNPTLDEDANTPAKKVIFSVSLYKLYTA